MTLKGDVKFKGKVTRGLKNNLRNLLDFHGNSWNFGNLNFDGILLFKACKDLDEKVEESYVSWQWSVMQSLKKKLTLDSKYDMRNLGNFNVRSCKSENLHFDVILLPIVYKVSAKKHRRIISHDTGKRSKLWRNNFCLKNDMRNLVNFNPSSIKSENLHFDGLLL